MNQEKLDQALKKQSEVIAQALQIIIQLEVNNYELTELIKRRIPPQ